MEAKGEGVGQVLVGGGGIYGEVEQVENISASNL